MSTYLNNEKILYFPYTNIPNEPWMYQSILYWDTVGIIVPYGLIICLNYKKIYLNLSF